MIRPAELDAIVAGTVDLAFRRWHRPRVRVGTRMRTGVGLIEVTSVEQVDAATVSDRDAQRAGAPSAQAVRDALGSDPDRPVHRIGLRYAGPDPRIALRESLPAAGELEELTGWLRRLDRAADGPWTRASLELIDRHPGRRAPDLAAELDRPTPDFKRDIRKLKERGLTESLDIGYRLSPRGAAVLDHLAGVGHRPRPGPGPGTPLPAVGAAARRALTGAGIGALEQLSGWSEADLLALRGVGPVAIERLRRALHRAGQGDLGQASD